MDPNIFDIELRHLDTVLSGVSLTAAGEII